RHHLQPGGLVCPAGRAAPRRLAGAWLRRRLPVPAHPAVRPGAARGRVGRFHCDRSAFICLRALGSPAGKPLLTAIKTVTKTATTATRVLVISRAAGGMNPEVEAKLRQAFAVYLVVDFDPG